MAKVKVERAWGKVEEMELLKKAERGCRLVKGQVFLWPGATDWKQLWE